MADLWGFEHVLANQPKRKPEWYESLPEVAGTVVGGVVDWKKADNARQLAMKKMNDEEARAQMLERGRNTRADAVNSLNRERLGLDREQFTTKENRLGSEFKSEQERKQEELRERARQFDAEMPIKKQNADSSRISAGAAATNANTGREKFNQGQNVAAIDEALNSLKDQYGNDDPNAKAIIAELEALKGDPEIQRAGRKRDGTTPEGIPVYMSASDYVRELMGEFPVRDYKQQGINARADAAKARAAAPKADPFALSAWNNALRDYSKYGTPTDPMEQEAFAADPEGVKREREGARSRLYQINPNAAAKLLGPAPAAPGMTPLRPPAAASGASPERVQQLKARAAQLKGDPRIKEILASEFPDLQ